MSRIMLTTSCAAAAAAMLIGCPAGDDGGSPQGETSISSDGATSPGDDANAADEASASSDGGMDTSDGADSTGTADPCDACDPVATCEDDLCVCPQGYAGDGLACADIDECTAGLADCDPNATCTNDEGGFTCACNDGFVGDGSTCAWATSCADGPCDDQASCTDGASGYTCSCDEGWSGDGFSCADINECAQGTAGCDVNASCANEPGGFDCTCDNGFVGNGFTCTGTAGYGDACVVPDVCASSICIGAPYNHCTVLCNQAIANHCPDVGAAGLCVPIDNDEFACVGDLTFGLDADDAILGSGDAATRFLNTITDSDLFQLPLPSGSFLILVEPDPDDDIALEMYDGIGQPIGVINDVGPGEFEGTFLDTSGGVSFAVVRNVGNSTGQYTISVEPE